MQAAPRFVLAGLVVLLAQAGLVQTARAQTNAQTNAQANAQAASSVAAGWAREQSAQCVAAIAASEAGEAIPPGLLGAIARAESGRPIPPLPGLQPWPWAVNADGAAMYFDTRAAAVAWTAAALARGVRQVDVGCMQINLQAHPAAFPSLDVAFDPGANAAYGARFLRRLHSDAGGNWFAATGFYHSRTPELAADYRQRVTDIAAGRTPALSLGLPLYMRAIQQGTLRIALAGGGVLRINVNRQPARLRRARMSPCQVAAVLGDYMARSATRSCAVRPSAAAQASPIRALPTQAGGVR